MDTSNFSALVQGLRSAPEANRAEMQICAEDLLRNARELAPKGPTLSLESSGRVEETADGFAVVFGDSDAPYALAVHERLDLHHPSGQAKFLEQPLVENTSAYLARQQAAFSAEISK